MKKYNNTEKIRISKAFLKTISVKHKSWWIFSIGVVLSKRTVSIRNKSDYVKVKEIYSNLLNDKNYTRKIVNIDGGWDLIKFGDKDLALHELYHSIQFENWGVIKYFKYGLASVFNYNNSKIEKDANFHTNNMIKLSIDDVLLYIFNELPESTIIELK